MQDFKENLIVFLIGLLGVTAIFSFGLNTVRYNERIPEGTLVVIEIDTLKIIKYFPFLDEYTLSNGDKIDGKILRVFK